MKYTKDEYIRLGRTLQKKVAEDLSDNVIQFTTVAVTFEERKYKSFYNITKCYDSNPFDTETVICDIRCFEKYEEMSEYLISLGFSIDELLPAKGLKIKF
jgi:hypothetical protein